MRWPAKCILPLRSHKHFRETGLEGRKTMISKNNNWKRNVMVIVAAVSATAATASAQEGTLKATVPFAFSVNRSLTLEPGNYTVARSGYFLQFHNEETGRSVAIVNAIGLQGKADEQPSLTFDCVGRHCQIRAIHMGGGALGAEVPAPKLSKSDQEELAVVNIPLEPNRGE
jgi:hypothetical protein